MKQLKIVLILSALAVLLLVWIKKDVKLGFIPTATTVINSASVFHNGIGTFSYRVALRAGTTTPCAIQAPNATTTLVHASVHIRTATSTSNFVEMATSTTAYATTTRLASFTIEANKYGTLVSTTTIGGYSLIEPLSWVVTKFGTDYGTTTAPVGNCEVIFRTVS